MSIEEIDERLIIKYLNKELDNSGMLRVDRWMALSTENMKKFNRIRSNWLDQKEEKLKAEKADKPRMKAQAAKTESGKKLEPVKTTNSSKAIVLILAIGIALMGMAIAIFFGASKG